MLQTQELHACRMAHSRGFLAKPTCFDACYESLAEDLAVPVIMAFRFRVCRDGHRLQSCRGRPKPLQGAVSESASAPHPLQAMPPAHTSANLRPWPTWLASPPAPAVLTRCLGCALWPAASTSGRAVFLLREESNNPSLGFSRRESLSIRWLRHRATRRVPADADSDSRPAAAGSALHLRHRDMSGRLLTHRWRLCFTTPRDSLARRRVSCHAMPLPLRFPSVYPDTT